VRRAQQKSAAPPRSDWCTPTNVINTLERFAGQVLLDPATNVRSQVRAKINWVRPGDELDPSFVVREAGEYRKWIHQDGLEADWVQSLELNPSVPRNLIYVNPPYGRKENKAWARKIREQASLLPRNLSIVALVPANTETNWFAEYWNEADVICFVRGRLKFQGAEHVADFASALVYFGVARSEFRSYFHDLGRCIEP